MQIYSISIVHTPPSDTAVVLSNTSDLSSLGFFQRGSAAEFMAFLSKTIAERTPQGQRQVVQYQSYVAHIYNRGGEEQLAGKDGSSYLRFPPISIILTKIGPSKLFSLRTRNTPLVWLFFCKKRFLMNS